MHKAKPMTRQVASFDIYGPPMPEALRAVLVNILAMHGATLHIHDTPAPSLDTVAALEADLAKHKADMEATRAELLEAKTALGAVRAVLKLDALPPAPVALPPAPVALPPAPVVATPEATSSNITPAPRPHDFAARFSFLVRESPHIPPRIKGLLLALAMRQDPMTGVVCASMEDLAADTHTSRRTIVRYVQHAAEWGWFVHEPGNGRGHVSRFTLPTLEEATTLAATPRCAPAWLEAPQDEFITRFIAAFQAAPLPPAVHRFLTVLATFYDPPQGIAPASKRDLARHLGISMTNVTIQRDRAEALGWISYTPTSGVIPTHYRLHIPTLHITPKTPTHTTPDTKAPPPVKTPSTITAYVASRMTTQEHALAWRAHLAAQGPQSIAQMTRAMRLSYNRTQQIARALTAPHGQHDWHDFRAGTFRAAQTRGIPQVCIYLAHQLPAVRALGWTPDARDVPPTPTKPDAQVSLPLPMQPPKPRTPDAHTALLDTMCVLEERGPSTLREVADALQLDIPTLHNLLSSLGYREIERRSIPESRFHILYLPDQHAAAIERAEAMRGYRILGLNPKPTPSPEPPSNPS